ncbi:hypothetical protein FHU38_002988 [Saccharomonospora amisosensis]|uniref:DUF3592 domain-containing protein n=1 Tax=Saccharomonospora amisosensis TaxID=1128677 RepID=A0A7X5URW9_9PSEU|nr:DUF3592 domain-containing protein [Saccharomonospora amisosensis]NIJ12644.1 hypothetical protein [Saccharomonospora amisosensis]
MTPVDALMAVSGCIGLATLVDVAGKAVHRRRLRLRGVRTTATVIDHVVTETRRVGATVESQPVKDKHWYIVAEFEYGPGRLMRIAEPCKRLTPVGEQLEVDYLPDKPDNARLHVTAATFARAVVVQTLVGLVFLMPVAGIVGS